MIGYQHHRSDHNKNDGNGQYLGENSENTRGVSERVSSFFLIKRIDDEIERNGNEKMKQVKKGETVLICYGSAHFYYQQPRMERAGWEKQKIQNLEKLFATSSEEFRYPESMVEVIQECIDYYEDGRFMEHVKGCVTNPEAWEFYEEYARQCENLYKMYKEMVAHQQLYYEEK